MILIPSYEGNPDADLLRQESIGRVRRGVGDHELLKCPFVLVLDRLVEVFILVKVGTGLPDHAAGRIAFGYDEHPLSSKYIESP